MRVPASCRQHLAIWGHGQRHHMAHRVCRQHSTAQHSTSQHQ
jgi:hypothetical protein